MSDWIGGWERLKSAIVPPGASEHALIHLHGGMVVYVLLVLTMPRRFRSVWPPAIVTALVLVNELVDLARWLPAVPAWLWRDSGGDIVNTILWPWVIWIVARRGVRRVRRAPVDRPVDQPSVPVWVSRDAGDEGGSTGR